MAGPAPKELQQFCTGCTQHLKVTASSLSSTTIYSASVPTGLNQVLLSNITITGIGKNSLSGVTGFIIGSMSLLSPRSLTGNCTAVTGSLTFTGSTGATGVTGWRASSITGCTGTSPCQTNIDLVFNANPNIWYAAPSAVVLISQYDYTYGNVNQLIVLNSGQQSFSGNISYYQPLDCGYSAHSRLDYSVRIPGYSGYISNDVWLETICKPCLLG